MKTQADLTLLTLGVMKKKGFLFVCFSGRPTGHKREAASKFVLFFFFIPILEHEQ